jgi:hypothetical protein
MQVCTRDFSKITDIPSSTQVRPFTIYSPRHTSSIGRVGAAHSSRYSISQRDIVIRRPAFKDTKSPSRRLFNSTSLIAPPRWIRSFPTASTVSTYSNHLNCTVTIALSFPNPLHCNVPIEPHQSHHPVGTAPTEPF